MKRCTVVICIRHVGVFSVEVRVALNGAEVSAPLNSQSCRVLCSPGSSKHFFGRFYLRNYPDAAILSRHPHVHLHVRPMCISISTSLSTSMSGHLATSTSTPRYVSNRKKSRLRVDRLTTRIETIKAVCARSHVCETAPEIRSMVIRYLE